MSTCRRCFLRSRFSAAALPLSSCLAAAAAASLAQKPGLSLVTAGVAEIVLGKNFFSAMPHKLEAMK